MVALVGAAALALRARRDTASCLSAPFEHTSRETTSESTASNHIPFWRGSAARALRRRQTVQTSPSDRGSSTQADSPPAPASVSRAARPLLPLSITSENPTLSTRSMTGRDERQAGDGQGFTMLVGGPNAPILMISEGRSGSFGGQIQHSNARLGYLSSESATSDVRHYSRRGYQQFEPATFSTSTERSSPSSSFHSHSPSRRRDVRQSAEESSSSSMLGTGARQPVAGRRALTNVGARSDISGLPSAINSTSRTDEVSDLDEPQLAFVPPRAMLAHLMEDYQQYLRTHYERPRTLDDEASSVDRMREHMRAQRSELHALGARLHGLRLILSLSQHAATLPTSVSGLVALQRLLDALGESAPPTGVPESTINELMPETLYCEYVQSMTSGAGFAPERVVTECSVCLEALTEEQSVRVLGCQHAFHAGCIDEWFARSTLCPCCKRAVC